MIVILLLVLVVFVFFLLQMPSIFNMLTFGLLLPVFVYFSSFQGSLERSALFFVVTALSSGLLLLSPDANRSRPVSRKRQRKKKKRMVRPDKTNPATAAGALNIPGYELMEKVGSGGMASVFRARRKSDNKIVALKIPMEQYVADAKFIRRFHREAEVAQRLDHINIVRTYEHGSVGIRHYMSMEYIDGRSLESYVENGDITVELSVEVLKAVAKALQHIHSVGIVHRDIKPANIMITREGISSLDPLVIDPSAVKLMDFGIAGGKVLTRLTMTGARVGTPVYMSPEQARGLKIDHRSDIYSLGLVLYEMLTGQTAFKGGYEAIVHQQVFQTPPPPRQLNLDIPKKLDQLVMDMIAKDPDERPRLTEVIEILEAGNFDDNTVADLPSRIIITVSARQGILRILDTKGSLHTSAGNIGMDEKSFSAAPLAIALDLEKKFYASMFEYRVGQEKNQMIYRLDKTGNIVDSFGDYGMKPGELLYPISISVAPNGNVYILDSETLMVQVFDSEGKYLFNFGGKGEGKGLFNDPKIIIVASDSNVYILDYGNKQVQRLNSEGIYQTRWAFKLGGSEDGVRDIDGFFVDAENNIYISDATGGKVRKISTEGKVVESYALEALQGEAVDALVDLGVDHQGNLYVARRGGHLIRKYDLDGRLVATIEAYAPIVQMIVDIDSEHLGI